MRDDGRPPLDKDKEIRIPLDLLREDGVTAGILRTYAAIRSRMGFEAAADNFLESWPGTESLVEGSGVCRRTIVSATRWLEERDYIIKERGLRKSVTYWVIVRRREFLDDVTRYGRAEAIDRYHEWRRNLEDESRVGQAKQSARRRIAQGAQGKSAMDCTYQATRVAEGAINCTPPMQSIAHEGAEHCLQGVQSVAPDLCSSDLGFKNCDSENRGSTGVELVSASTTPELQNGNHNSSQGPPKETTRPEPQPPPHRCIVEGSLLKRYRGSCSDCQERYFWNDRFYETELRKFGLRPPVRAEVAS